MLANVEHNDNTTSEELLKEVSKLKEKYQTIEEEQEENDKVRREEIEYVHKMKFYDTVPSSEAYQQTGKGPTSVRWIDINKGDSECPNYRSMLVAREINTSKRNDLFAAIPP